jgi:hypothetical protein
MLESAISRKIQVALKERGAFSWKTHGGSMQARGRPDIEGMYPVKVILQGGAERVICVAFGIEVKQPGGKLTALQAHWLDTLEALGGFACVAHNDEEALALLDRIDAYLGNML